MRKARAAARELAKPKFHPLFAAQFGDDCLDRLNTASQAVERAGATNEDGRSLRVNATTGVGELLKQGRAIVRYLRAIIRAASAATAGTDPIVETLRNFDAAAHVVQSSGGSGGGVPTPAPESTPALAPTLASVSTPAVQLAA